MGNLSLLRSSTDLVRRPVATQSCWILCTVAQAPPANQSVQRAAPVRLARQPAAALDLTYRRMTTIIEPAKWIGGAEYLNFPGLDWTGLQVDRHHRRLVRLSQWARRARDRTDRRTAGQQDSRTAQDSRPQDSRHCASTLPPVATHYVGLARGVGVGLGSKTRVKPC